MVEMMETVGMVETGEAITGACLKATMLGVESVMGRRKSAEVALSGPGMVTSSASSQLLRACAGSEGTVWSTMNTHCRLSLSPDTDRKMFREYLAKSPAVQYA